jgi:O-antigen/teichoic acid export membrane protein
VTGAVGTLLVAALALAGLRRLDLLLVVYAGALLVTAILSWRAVARTAGPLPLRPWHAEAGAIRELAGFGGVLQLTTVVAQLGDQALRVVLGARFGAAAIGTYDLASRAAMAPRSVMASLLVALVPFAAARERQGGSAALSDALQRSTRYAMLVLLAGTAAGLAVAGPLMAVWLGDAVETASDTRRLFELLLVSLAVQSIASPMVALARAAGRPRPEALVTLAAQPIAVAVAWAAPTPVMAVAGAAVVLMASAAVLWTWLKVSLGLRGLSPDELARLGAVAAAVGLAAWGARQLTEVSAPWPWVPLVLVPPALAGLTGALAVAWNGVSAEERRVLGRLIPGRHRHP